MIHHITRATRHLIFWSLIVTALGLTGVRLLLTGVDGYKNDLAGQLSELMGAPVTIGQLRAKMRGFSPELILTEIDISSQITHAKPAIELKEIRLGLNLLDALLSRDLMSSSWITLVGAKLSVKRKQDGSFAVVGLKTSDEQPLWLLQGRKYEVLQSEVIWQDEKTNSRPVKFAPVDLAIINDGERHRINVLMKLPKNFGDELRVSMDLEGNISEPSSVHGLVYAEGKQFKPAELVNSVLPYNIKINAGAGNFQIWSNWQHAQPVSVSGNAQLQPLKLHREDRGMLAIDNLEARFSWKLGDRLADENRPWQLEVNHFVLETARGSNNAGRHSVSGAMNVRAQYNNESLSPKIGVFVEHLDLQNASALLQFFAPPQDTRIKLIQQAQLKGELEKFSLFADGSDHTAAVNGKFAKLGFASMNAAPAIDNLTGNIKGTDKNGVIRLATEHARFNAAGLFRSTLDIAKLHGPLGWLQTDTEWVLSGNNIALDSPDIRTRSKLRLIIPKNTDKAFLDLQSAFTGNDVSKARHYLPAGVMQKTVVNWLDHAFISGRVTQGGFLFHGRPSDFPFVHDEGVFETLFDVEQMELNYHPDWPHLTGVNAQVLFYQDGLRVNLKEGQSGKVKINPTEVTIPVLGKSRHLLVQGSLDSGIADALNFLQQTPLKSKIDPVLNAITPQGDTRIVLDMKIPLEDGASGKVNGSAQLNNAKLAVKSPDIRVTQLRGLLKFNEQGIFSDVIHGAALGHPIRITIDNAEQETLIKIKGHTDIRALQKQFKLPWWELATGAADYFLQLHLPFNAIIEDAETIPELSVQSSLTGIALNLPGVLAKTKEQSSPLTVTFKLTDKDKQMPVELNYDNKLKAAIKLDATGHGLYSGHVLLGDGSVAQRQEAGLKIEINRDQLALQDWFNLAAQNSNADSGIDIREIKIHSDHALWNKTALGAFDLALKQNGKQWTGTIGSVFANGKLRFPIHGKDSDKIDLNMEMLDISALKQLKFQSGEVLDFSPKSIPLFNVSSNKMLWKSIDLGQLILDTERLPSGIGFKRIELTDADEKLTATGDWVEQGKQSATHIQSRLEMSKAGHLFARLGATNDLAETSGVIDFAAGWNAAPYQASLSDLKGKVEVNLKNGRILSIEPGFGRVLGILAMAQWIKRLQLDFSDIYEEGLSFNSIKGRFDLDEGKAITNNLIVDAVPAKITITGNTDLIGRTVDHIVNVAPKSADAVPIAGTIVGKVANLVARSLTGKDQEGFLFGSQYLVKGAWGNAQIMPLHENDGLLQKTWNGITDFPWMEQQKKQ